MSTAIKDHTQSIGHSSPAGLQLAAALTYYWQCCRPNFTPHHSAIFRSQDCHSCRLTCPEVGRTRARDSQKKSTVDAFLMAPYAHTQGSALCNCRRASLRSHTTKQNQMLTAWRIYYQRIITTKVYFRDAIALACRQQLLSALACC